MLKHITYLPYRSIHLYMVYSSSSIGMNTPTFSVNVATMMATPATVLTITTSTMTKQALALEDPKHCNTDGWPSCYNLRYNDVRQS